MNILSLAMLVAAVLFLYFVIKNINKNKILFEQAFMWLLIALSLILIALVNSIPEKLAHLFGFTLTSNFLLSFAVFFLLIMTFLFSVQLSQQREQSKTLVQELSMLKRRVELLEQKEKTHE